MQLSELKTVLAGTGLPVAYLAFPVDKAPAMPFIIFQELGSDNFGADNKVYFSATLVQVDLFCSKRSRTTEQKLETSFDDSEIFWERDISFNDDERFYKTTYIVEI